MREHEVLQCGALLEQLLHLTLGCAWVGLGRVKEIFWPNPPWWVKKNSTQPNSSHKSNPTHIGWLIFFITIIIKLSRKNISRLPPELINKIYINI